MTRGCVERGIESDVDKVMPMAISERGTVASMVPQRRAPRLRRMQLTSLTDWQRTLRLPVMVRLKETG